MKVRIRIAKLGTDIRTQHLQTQNESSNRTITCLYMVYLTTLQIAGTIGTYVGVGIA
jgi:hypothetical protein